MGKKEGYKECTFSNGKKDIEVAGVLTLPRNNSK